MVRQFEETRRSHVVVALDNLAEHYASDDEFELAVSAAASIAAQTFREEKELTPVHRRRAAGHLHLPPDDGRLHASWSRSSERRSPSTSWGRRLPTWPRTPPR
jgi:uncharacterized protein (DUF58 family)